MVTSHTPSDDGAVRERFSRDGIGAAVDCSGDGDGVWAVDSVDAGDNPTMPE